MSWTETGSSLAGVVVGAIQGYSYANGTPIGQDTAQAVLLAVPTVAHASASYYRAREFNKHPQRSDLADMLLFPLHFAAAVWGDRLPDPKPVDVSKEAVKGGLVGMIATGAGFGMGYLVGHIAWK